MFFFFFPFSFFFWFFSKLTFNSLLKELESNGGKFHQNSYKQQPNPYTNDTIVNVLPLNFKENLIGMGLTGQLYLEGEKEGKRGGEYEAEGAGVVFVLGAGNFSAPIEVLTKVYI